MCGGATLPKLVSFCRTCGNHRPLPVAGQLTDPLPAYFSCVNRGYGNRYRSGASMILPQASRLLLKPSGFVQKMSFAICLYHQRMLLVSDKLAI